MRRPLSGRWAAGAAAFVAVGLMVLATGIVASAGGAPAPELAATPTTTPTTTDDTLFVSYTVSGETTLAKFGSSVAISGELDSTIDLATGALTGTINLRDAAGTFLGFGAVPTKATTHFVQDGPVTGTFSGGIVDATVSLFLTLPEHTVSVNGTELDIGPGCRTAQPSVVRIQGPLNLLGTTNFLSRLTIGNFTGCGVGENLDPLLDGLVAGTNNLLATTLTLRCSAQGCTPSS